MKKLKWNGREIGLLSVKRIGWGYIRLQLIGVDLKTEIFTRDAKALRLLDTAFCEITRCTKQPANCNTVFKKYPGITSPFGWNKYSFTRKDWAEYPSPDYPGYSDIAECDIQLADKTTFRALVAIEDVVPEMLAEAAENCRLRKLVVVAPEEKNQAAENEKLLAPIIEEIKKVKLKEIPACKRKWWQNVRAKYNEQSDQKEKDKWLAVVKVVIQSANEANNKKPVADKQTDYLTPRMMGTLLKKWNTPSAFHAKILADYAEQLRRLVTREEQKAKKI